LQDEVEQKAGEKYTRAKPYDGRSSRWGVNLGSVREFFAQSTTGVKQMVDGM